MMMNLDRRQFLKMTFAKVRRSPATRIMVIQNLPGLVRQPRRPVGESR